MRKILPLLLAAALLLTACGAAETAPAPPEPTAYEKDFALLWQELEESYPYLPYLASRGLDPEAVRARYEEELAEVRDIAAFQGLLQRMLAELGNFAHLNLVTPGLYQDYYSILFLDESIAAMPEFDAYREALQDGRLSEIYRPPEHRSTGAEEQGSSLPAVTVLYYPDCRALHLKISSFAQELVARDRDVVALALDRYPEAEHIIFDITGNGGGSDLYWMQDLVAPFGGSWSFRYRTFYRQSDTFARFAPDLAGLPIDTLESAPAWAAELGMTHCFLSETILPEPGEPSGRPVQSAAKRWLLVDGGVYSAADKFAAFCRTSGWATVVGTRTSGDGLNTMPVLLLLPETGLLIRFSDAAGENPDGTMNAAQGTAPEILCIRGQLPLSRCLELIRGE